MDSRYEVCMFVGYPKGTRGGLFYSAQDRKVIVSTHFTSLEEYYMNNFKPKSKVILEELSSDQVDAQLSKPVTEQEEHQQPDDQHRIIPEQPSLLEPRRSGRVTMLPARYMLLGETYTAILDEHVEDPTSYNEALIDRDVEFWKKTMNQEMESIYFNKVWELVEAPNGEKPIGCKWIYKRKRGVDEMVEIFKARLITTGFTQKNGIDYEETISPVAMLKSIRILFSIAAMLDYEIWQMDVKTAFLNGHIEENIYMQQPDGFIQKGQEHMKLWEVSCMSCFALGQTSVLRYECGAISWRSVKQSCITDSTTEAEYVAASEAAKEVVLLRKFLQDLEVVPAVTAPLKLFCDNSGARGDVEVTQIASQQNLADSFTKAIPGKPLNLHLESMALTALTILSAAEKTKMLETKTFQSSRCGQVVEAETARPFQPNFKA
ncbi:hypothetical protein WN943_003517 [Citrus x changshan-huyou]